MPTKRRTTMADIKRRATAAGSHYFDRGNSRFFGAEKFWGPYVGPNGTFFVQRNKGGISVRPVSRDHTIGYVDGRYSSVEEARAAARRMAGKADRKVANPARKTAPANESEADELRMHIDNTRRLYDQKRAIEKSLLRKVKVGKYNHALAPKAFLFVTTEGAKDYRREYGGDASASFTPATRLMAAKEYVREFEGEQEFRDAKGVHRNPSPRRKAPAKRSKASYRAAAKKGAATRKRNARAASRRR